MSDEAELIKELDEDDKAAKYLIIRLDNKLTELQAKYDRLHEFVASLDFENWCGKRLQYASKGECEIVLDARKLLKELEGVK